MHKVTLVDKKLEVNALLSRDNIYDKEFLISEVLGSVIISDESLRPRGRADTNGLRRNLEILKEKATWHSCTVHAYNNKNMTVFPITLRKKYQS